MLNLPSSTGDPNMDSLKHFRKRSSKSLPSDELANSARATFRPRSRKARLMARWPKQSAKEPRRTPGVDLRVRWLRCASFMRVAAMAWRVVALDAIDVDGVASRFSHRRARDEHNAVRDIIEVVPL